MAYNYTIIAKLPGGGRLQYDGEEFEMMINKRTVTIKTIGSEKNIKNSSWIKFSCTGFGSELQALEHGRTLKAQLTYSAMKGGLILDVGRDLSAHPSNH